MPAVAQPSNTVADRLADLEYRAVVALRQQGVGKDRIAEQLGVSRTRTRKIVNELETPRRQRRKR